ncbi:hypothetical protein BDR04DRAFT_1159579 [Suillus decipiens]|nr:hypothetical protein BDR04DRAFT_1159579 [Suillus decipiens]
MSQAKNVILNLLGDSHNFQHHIASCAATTILKLTYGKTVPTSETDPEIKETRHITVISFSHASWLLLSGLHTVAQISSLQSNEDIGLSPAKCNLKHGHLYGLTEIEAACVRRVIWSWIPHGKVSSFSLLMAAARFHEEQAKVQAEIDAVIGKE